MLLPRAIRGREEGSVLLALFAALVIGGVVVALYSVTTSTTEAARRDRDFSRAIQVSDAGLQQAFTVLAQLPESAFSDPVSMSGTLEEGTYEWSAEPRGFGEWNVRVEGEVNGVRRVLEAEMGQAGLFDLAAYSEEVFSSSGNERFGSYGSGGLCTGDVGECRGWVGSNAGFEMGSRTADRAILYAGAGVTAPTRITTPLGVVRMTTEPAYPDLAQAAYADGGPCAGVTPRAYNFTGGDLIEGEVYCATDVTFQTGRHDIQPNTDPSKQGEPAVFYMTGSLNLIGEGGGGGNSDYTDFLSCNATRVACVNLGENPPNASMLQFYIQEGGASSGFGTGGNHGMIAAAIYAPWASCNLSAQTGVWGAMVCGQITGAGNWALYFDERLVEINQQAFTLDAWREEVGQTSSFD